MLALVFNQKFYPAAQSVSIPAPSPARLVRGLWPYERKPRPRVSYDVKTRTLTYNDKQYSPVSREEYQRFGHWPAPEDMLYRMRHRKRNS